MNIMMEYTNEIHRQNLVCRNIFSNDFFLSLFVSSYMPSCNFQNQFVEVFRGVPRFGHARNFSLLFSESKSLRNDYTLGTLFVGLFLFAFFLIWMLLLCIFMCCGPKKVGFLAGFRMKQPYGTLNFRTPATVRTLFVFSSLIVIAAVVISTFFGGFYDLKVASDQGLDITQVRLVHVCTVLHVCTMLHVCAMLHESNLVIYLANSCPIHILPIPDAYLSTTL